MTWVGPLASVACIRLRKRQTPLETSVSQCRCRWTRHTFRIDMAPRDSSTGGLAFIADADLDSTSNIITHKSANSRSPLHRRKNVANRLTGPFRRGAALVGRTWCGVTTSVNGDEDLRVGMTFRKHGWKGTRAVEVVHFDPDTNLRCTARLSRIPAMRLRIWRCAFSTSGLDVG